MSGPEVLDSREGTPVPHTDAPDADMTAGEAAGIVAVLVVGIIVLIVNGLPLVQAVAR